MSSPSISIVWFRQDLRLADNPALAAACARGGKILPVYILDDETPGSWRPGGASRWWLHESLSSLDRGLEVLGAKLCLRRGKAAEVIGALTKETGASAVFWNRCYEAHAIRRDTNLKANLRDQGIDAESFNANLLFEPWEIKNGQGGPYKVFTPFWKALLAGPAPATPEPPPASVDGLRSVAGDSLADWNLRPDKPDWAGGLRKQWTPGEQGAGQRLDAFLDEAAETYKTRRDQPAESGTSRLSPHLHWGEISPRQVWQTCQRAIATGSVREDAVMAFLRQLAWRDFSHVLIYHWPDFPEKSWKPEYDSFPWRDDEQAFTAWCRGRTGYPIVDAGMRELWHTGWMHNRVRMITASFLIKHLLIPWQRGEAWFWDTLVDADLANNAAGWQWVAGSGADASPYFRIFNPITQGEKFDPQGHYIRRWVPELSKLPNDFLNKPWDAPAEVLTAAGVTLGETYPLPMVDHKAARDRALAGYQEMKKQA
ncbi:deoxyribodipyrimidine photo-lyase [Pelagibius litoralis]|uniref:Deoxyribodipyrimidine photo-lyase n=1 Tax=Pelagibius litoralis TaxID=374515 RepID=A0A967C776_9PROT|nr:deoxyribodipyrimidine photo-lyase [Pelagibius litoralis]NIA68876.1 deoxyribodipyrimidine photo-lyase [Pelagibius litoralis]